MIFTKLLKIINQYLMKIPSNIDEQELDALRHRNFERAEDTMSKGIQRGEDNES